MRIIRRFRPQVVVSIFPNDGRGGHGQHQAAGVVAHEAFALAGDPKAFPDLAAEGLAPWTPQVLYRSAWFNREEATMTLPLGGLEPFSGKSVSQLAAESRSRHRSQSMGRVQELGGKETRLAWVQGGAGREGSTLFAGVDTRLQAIALLLPDGAARGEVATELDLAENAARQARARLTPREPGAVAPLLREALMHLRVARELAGRVGSPPAELPGKHAAAPNKAAANKASSSAGSTAAAQARAAVALIDDKIAAGERALAAAAGVVLDAAADHDSVAAGGSLKLKLSVWNASTEALAVDGLTLVAEPGWSLTEPAGGAHELAAGQSAEWTAEATPVVGAPPTAPYFSGRPLQGWLYDWSAVPAEQRGEPFQPAPIRVHVAMTQNGAPFELERDVVLRTSEEAVGEIRRPIRAVPALEVAVEPHLLVVPAIDAKPQVLRVALRSNAAAAIDGRITASPAAGWPASTPVDFHLAPGAERTIEVVLTPPAKAAAGRSVVRVTAVAADGGSYAVSAPVIDLPHIPPTPRVVPAEVAVVTADLTLPALRRVGYVRGASDRVPEALLQVGLPVELLSSEVLRTGDLSGYDAIVIGSRAYETEPALASANPRLLEFARAGGLVLVQYQQYPYVDGAFAPYPLQMARPHDRVTDETSAVKVLDPAHRVFTTPNHIGAADWDGWVQERGLYFAHSWDAAWTPLLELADKGQAPQRGGLLIATVGKGTFVYTGLAFFRELPAGVPGAHRLFANLLALGTRPTAP